MKPKPEVVVVIGSESDREIMAPALAVLENLGLRAELRVMSAHRQPEAVAEFAAGARAAGVQVIIAAAGLAAHLAGAIAARTTLPVIGVPIAAGTLGGLDALLATVQMPGGVPVATVAINGAKNAALLAAQILAVGDPELAARLDAHRAGREAKPTRSKGRK